MSRNLTSKPWWGLAAMRERVKALRESIEPEIASKRTDEVNLRPALASEPVTPPWHPPRPGNGYHHKVKVKRARK